MIETTKYGKKAYICVMDDKPTMHDIIMKIVQEQKEMLTIDNRTVTPDELFRTSVLRLRKFRQYFNNENLKKQVDFALQV